MEISDRDTNLSQNEVFHIGEEVHRRQSDHPIRSVQWVTAHLEQSGDGETQLTDQAIKKRLFSSFNENELD